MGQYYKIVNIDKQQYLSTYAFNEGAKLLEFGCSSEGTLTALAVLLADGNGRGGGDLHSDNPIIGSWSGDRIVVAGDYADEGKFLKSEEVMKYAMLQGESQVTNLYGYAVEYFEDISGKVLTAMLDDNFIYETYEKTNLSGETKDIFEKVKKKKKAKAKKEKV